MSNRIRSTRRSKRSAQAPPGRMKISHGRRSATVTPAIRRGSVVIEVARSGSATMRSPSPMFESAVAPHSSLNSCGRDRRAATVAVSSVTPGVRPIAQGGGARPSAHRIADAATRSSGSRPVPCFARGCPDAVDFGHDDPTFGRPRRLERHVDRPGCLAAGRPRGDPEVQARCHRRRVRRGVHPPAGVDDRGRARDPAAVRCHPVDRCRRPRVRAVRPLDPRRARPVGGPPAGVAVGRGVERRRRTRIGCDGRAARAARRRRTRRRLTTALDGVYLELAPVSLATPADVDGIDAARLLVAAWDAAGIPPTSATARSASIRSARGPARAAATTSTRDARQPLRSSPNSTSARPAGACARRRRHRVARVGRHRRAGAGVERRRGEPCRACAGRRRGGARSGVRPDRVPLGRHGRPVRDHRQVPRRSPSVGTGRRDRRPAGRAAHARSTTPTRHA